MTSIEQSIEVGVPARTAYNQWTQFEEFPRFMSGVREVEQIDDRHVRWREDLGDSQREWVMEICEQIPDKRIAWKSTSGPRNSGVVTFHRLADDRCKVMLQMELESDPESAEVFALARQDVERDLAGFKRFLESRGEETGGWRGRVAAPGERAPPGTSFGASPRASLGEQGER